MPSRRSDSDYEAPSEDADREASGEDENKGKGKGKHKRGGRRGGRAVRDRQFALQASSPPPIGSDIILVNRRADQAANLTTIAMVPALLQVFVGTMIDLRGELQEVRRDRDWWRDNSWRDGPWTQSSWGASSSWDNPAEHQEPERRRRSEHRPAPRSPHRRSRTPPCRLSTSSRGIRKAPSRSASRSCYDPRVMKLTAAGKKIAKDQTETPNDDQATRKPRPPQNSPLKQFNVFVNVDDHDFDWAANVYFCWIAQDASDEKHKDIVDKPCVLVADMNRHREYLAVAFNLECDQVVKKDIRIKWADLLLLTNNDFVDYYGRIRQTSASIRRLLGSVCAVVFLYYIPKGI